MTTGWKQHPGNCLGLSIDRTAHLQWLWVQLWMVQAKSQVAEQLRWWEGATC